MASGENYPVIRINARDLEIGRLYSKEAVVGNQQDKEKHLAQLQSGARFPVKVREQVQGGAPGYPTVWLELNLLDDKTMAMKVTDAEGKVLRKPTIQAKQQEMNKTMGMLPGSENQAKLPEGLLRMLQDNKQSGPRIGAARAPGQAMAVVTCARSTSLRSGGVRGIMVVKAIAGEVSKDKAQDEQKRQEAGDLYPAGCGLFGF